MEGNNISVNGINISLFHTRTRGTINGISISSIGNYSGVLTGLQVGIIGTGVEYLNGLTIGGCMSQSIEINGIQLSLIINLCKTLKGIGVSFINAQSFESLLTPWAWAKIALAIIVRLLTLGWYEVLSGEAYASLPGRSGTVAAIGSLMGMLGGALIWFVGWIAGQASLQVAMWLLLAGPIALMLFVPKPESSR